MGKNKTLKIIGGIDNGNGYIKAALRGEGGEVDRFDIPAGVAVVTRAADIPVPDSNAVEETAGDFFNKLDAQFDTPLVRSNHRHIFGTRGLRAESSRFREFDIIRDISKAEQDLSRIFIIGLFAGKALRDYVAAEGKLPEDVLHVEARVALALPINEYRDHRVRFASELKEGSHTVTLRNFETSVFVKVTFTDVVVTAEGSSAQFAIRQSGVKLTEAMLVDLRKHGIELPAGLTAQAVFDARNTVGIDIGEGTVNFPVYTDSQFNTDTSRTFPEGYGHVLMNALPILEKEGLRQKSRKKLANYLLEAPGVLKLAEWEATKAIVDEQAELWCEQLVEEFGKVFDDIRYDAEVCYVFGGGAGPLKDMLYPKLLERVGKSFPVLYLDSSYSRHLNRSGLLIAAEKIAKAQLVGAGK